MSQKPKQSRHSLRPIRAMVDGALKALNGCFNAQQLVGWLRGTATLRTYSGYRFAWSCCNPLKTQSRLPDERGARKSLATLFLDFFHLCNTQHLVERSQPQVRV